MFYCKEHAEQKGWPWPEDDSKTYTSPPTSYGPCELCPRGDGPKLCADVPSRLLPI